jgi:hypothetical protein
MKYLIGLFLTICVASTAYADVCATQLMPSFTGNQATQLCTKLGLDYSTDFNFITGKTIGIQEATAASACSGTVTATGTTAVTVSTTCATTGSRIMIARNAAPSGTAICWATNIVAGVSFDFDCSAAETSTFNWFIIHEAP